MRTYIKLGVNNNRNTDFYVKTYYFIHFIKPL